MNWCEKHNHFNRTCPWCEIEEMGAQLDQALEALEELRKVSTLLAFKIRTGIIAKRLQGKNKLADLEEEKFFKPWEKAEEKSKDVLQSIKGGESDD